MAVSTTGKVARMYATGGQTYIRLHGGLKPKYGYFRLSMTHSNYNALYSLLLSAAINRYNLRIRTTSDIVPTAIADVQYFVVDW